MPQDFPELDVKSHTKFKHEIKFDLRETWQRDISEDTYG